MRVRGDILPEAFTIETYPPKPSCVEVRLRENIKQVTETNAQTTVILYEYDEYTLIVKEKAGLKQEIEANLSDWLATGRTLEINESASIMQDMREALNILGVKE